MGSVNRYTFDAGKGEDSINFVKELSDYLFRDPDKNNFIGFGFHPVTGKVRVLCYGKLEESDTGRWIMEQYGDSLAKERTGRLP